MVTFTDRSSHQRCSIKKDVLKNFVKFAEKNLCQESLFWKHLFYGTPLDDCCRNGEMLNGKLHILCSAMLLITLIKIQMVPRHAKQQFSSIHCLFFLQFPLLAHSSHLLFVFWHLCAFPKKIDCINCHSVTFLSKSLSFGSVSSQRYFVNLLINFL